MLETIENWPRTRNGIRKRLRQAGKTGHDLDDATQDACTFVVQALAQGVEPALAIYRAVYRVLRGQTATYSPANHERWEREIDAAYVECAGVSQASRRAAACGAF